MKLTAVFEPAEEGGYTCFVEEIPAAISQGETIEEAKANLADALKLALQCQRELAEEGLSPHAVREVFEITEARNSRNWNAICGSMVAFCIARALPIAFGSTLRCTRSLASRAIAKSKRGRYGPSANNWKFRGRRNSR
jgi:predicted RNase H-like HicB family nuclease